MVKPWLAFGFVLFLAACGGGGGGGGSSVPAPVQTTAAPVTPTPSPVPITTPTPIPTNGAPPASLATNVPVNGALTSILPTVSGFGGSLAAPTVSAPGGGTVTATLWLPTSPSPPLAPYAPTSPHQVLVYGDFVVNGSLGNIPVAVNGAATLTFTFPAGVLQTGVPYLYAVWYGTCTGICWLDNGGLGFFVSTTDLPTRQVTITGTPSTSFTPGTVYGFAIFQ